MTSPIIPDFILKLFEQEVTKVNLSVVEVLCNHFSIDINEAKAVVEKNCGLRFNVIGESIEHIKIVKSTKPKKVSETKQDKACDSDVKQNIANNCCDARIFLANDLVVRQCSRSKLVGSNFCKMHQQKVESGKLKYGTIHEDKPEEISTPKLRSKIKRNIY
jgi:hypothetical protein